MIGIKTPFRISFAGGSSDIKSYYKNHGGAVISTSINKYMYHFIHKYSSNETRINYSETETIENLEKIKHPIVNAVSSIYQIKGLDITSVADFPKGTGLGSSSAYTVGLINGLSVYENKPLAGGELAELACKVEIDYLNRPIGKQDQYASTFGGLNKIIFNKDDSVEINNILLESDIQDFLNSSMALYKVGKSRNAHDVLKDQNSGILSGQNIKIIDSLKNLVDPMIQSLVSGNIKDVGELLTQGWTLKRKLSNKITNPEIDSSLDEITKTKGIYGYKLLGAGGGGYLLLIGESKSLDKLSEFSTERFEMGNNGSQILFNDKN